MKLLCKSIVIAAFSWGLAAPIALASSTQWQDVGGGKVRMLANMAGPEKIMGSVEIKLDEGWKTYWRSPGASGIPPRFDFSKSTGAKVGEVLYPAPYRLENSGVVISGYKKHVAFPFTATLEDAHHGNLKLDLLIGICEAICIPVKASFELPVSELKSSAFKEMQITQNALMKVPQAAPATMSIEKAAIKEGNDQLAVEIAFAEEVTGNDQVQLFVEDETGSFFEPVTAEITKKAAANGSPIASFIIPYEKSSDDLNLGDALLTFTVRVDDRSYEIRRKPDEAQ